MSDFFFGETSKNRMAGIDPRMREIADLALKLSHVDFGIPQHGGRRTPEEQNARFHARASRCDGYKTLSAHQSGRALDVFAIIGGKPTWEPAALAMVACAMLQAASILGHQLEWGGLWRSTKSVGGVPYGWDAGHFQLIED